MIGRGGCLARAKAGRVVWRWAPMRARCLRFKRGPIGCAVSTLEAFEAVEDPRFVVAAAIRFKGFKDVKDLPFVIAAAIGINSIGAFGSADGVKDELGLDGFDFDDHKELK